MFIVFALLWFAGTTITTNSRAAEQLHRAVVSHFKDVREDINFLYLTLGCLNSSDNILLFSLQGEVLVLDSLSVWETKWMSTKSLENYNSQISPSWL